MKTSIFNLNRVLLLLKKDYILNGKKYLLQLLTFILLIVSYLLLTNLFSGKHDNVISVITSLLTNKIVLLIYAIVYSFSLINFNKNKYQKQQYILTSSTNIEKITQIIIQVLLFFLIIPLVTILIVNLFLISNGYNFLPINLTYYLSKLLNPKIFYIVPIILISTIISRKWRYIMTLIISVTLSILNYTTNEIYNSFLRVDNGLENTKGKNPMSFQEYLDYHNFSLNYINKLTSSAEFIIAFNLVIFFIIYTRLKKVQA